MLVVWLLLIVTVHCAMAYRDYHGQVNCSIRVQAYSAVGDDCDAVDAEPVDGYVTLNGVAVWEAGWCSGGKPNARGLTVLTVDPITCTPGGDIRTFDTWSFYDASFNLVNHLMWLPCDSIIVGVTGDEPTYYLEYALPLLATAGVDVSDVEYRGNFAFVLQKGYPRKTLYALAVTNAVPVSTLNVHVIGYFYYGYVDPHRGKCAIRCLHRHIWTAERTSTEDLQILSSAGDASNSARRSNHASRHKNHNRGGSTHDSRRAGR